MAFYNNEEDENELDPNNQGGVQTSTESATISGQGGAPGQAPAPNTPDKPGNFVGISQYLEANKPQAAKLGDQTAGVINQSADQARQGVSALNQEADQKIKPISALDSGISQKISSGAEALTADERNLAKQTAAAKYTGPKAATDLGDVYTNAAKTTQTAENNINNSATEQGRMNLISQVNAKPRTQGMNVFDNTLLQAGGGREKLAQASTANQDVIGGLNSASDQIAGKIGRADDPSTPNIDESSGAIGQSAKSQADAYKTIQDALGSWKSGFAPKVSQAQQALIDQQNRVSGDLGDNQLGLDQETMDLLGLADGTRTYGVDLKNFINQVSPDQINASNVASAEDYARYGALADLAGEQSLMLKPEDSSKAGTAPKLSSKPGLNDAIGAAKAPFIEAAKDNAPASNFGVTGRFAGYTYNHLKNVTIPELMRFKGTKADIGGVIDDGLREISQVLALMDQNIGQATAVKKK